MRHQTQPNLHLLQVKLQKICRQLQQLAQSGKTITAKKLQSLTKRRHRYLQQLLSAGLPLAKAGGAFAFATFFTAQLHAQECNNFKNANAANSLKYYYHNGLPSYVNLFPAFVDIDSDGDLDCYTYGEGRPLFWKNVGTKEIPSYTYEYYAQGGFTGYVNAVALPVFADMDGDGDYDCFVPSQKWEDEQPITYVKYLENVGTKKVPSFVENASANPLSFVKGVGYPLTVTIADIDGDGDYDVVFSDGYTSHIYKNTGTKTAPAFTEVTESGGGNFSHRVYYDWNKDGLVDYFVEGKFYRNIGPTRDDLNYVPDMQSGPDLHGINLYALADVNNDGLPEAFNNFSDMYTVTPVPVVKATVGFAGITMLHATPKKGAYKYQWQRNGKDIPFATLPVLPALIPGYYTVTITNHCGTGFSLPYAYNTHAATFEEAEATAIPIAAAKDAINPLLKAYPNPFTQQFTLTLGNIYKPGSTTVRITDIQGRVVNVVKATGGTVHLGEALQKGVYIVQVLQNNAVIFTQKIIKE